jgi:prepilin-type N-terminal cleavage/methylation domain-containing protein
MGITETKRRGFTLIELMIVIAIIAVIAAIAIPGLLAAQRASNERNASASLKALVTAEADFRGNDRDGNLVTDFWTSDVYALWALIPITGGSTTPPPITPVTTNIIKLVDVSLAAADGSTQTGGYGCVDAAAIVVGSTKAGYIYRACQSQADTATPTTLRNDTDGPAFYGTVHDRSRFAFMAAPESLSAGKLMFAVNAGGEIWKYNLPTTYTATFTPHAPGTQGSSTINVGVASLNDASTFPMSPGAIGFSKMD